MGVGGRPRIDLENRVADDLLPRVWQLRATISAYDAAYVALAERRGLTLVTADARLARTTTAYCRVELIT
jgi:predicted nucleic acid-binding protein